MPRAYVLMTAMPPTKGHLHLIQFAAQLGDSAEVILCTQPDEPFAFERLAALRQAVVGLNANIHHIHKPLPQEPAEDPGFWDMWAGFLTMFGIQPGDYIVASEPYGLRLSQEVPGTIFMPYDIDRAIYQSKATLARENPGENFSTVLPQFQHNLRKTITIFGAESTGKTTLSRKLAEVVNGWWLPEWARPYLETVSTDITDESMTAIWEGQRAMQLQAQMLEDKPFIIQDTDLFSTVGYWDYMMESETPAELVYDAGYSQSDLYIVTQSNIPFEEDPIRYGGDHRETEDQHWLDILDNYGLPYLVLKSNDRNERLLEATGIVKNYFMNEMAYERRGNG